MYRVQRRHGLRTKQRTTPRTHVARASTVHQATGPNQVWSWDITWLPTTMRGSYLYLYLVMDVWSRRIVGWRIAERESADVAAVLMAQSCAEGGIDPRGLVLHSDNGKPMRSSTMISTLQWLGVVPSFSRPHVSDDIPYSEALFRTVKHTPAYPRLPFADLACANRWVARFVDWYNGTHRHSATHSVLLPRSGPNARHASDGALQHTDAGRQIDDAEVRQHGGQSSAGSGHGHAHHAEEHQAERLQEPSGLRLDEHARKPNHSKTGDEPGQPTQHFV